MALKVEERDGVADHGRRTPPNTLTGVEKDKMQTEFYGIKMF